MRAIGRGVALLAAVALPTLVALGCAGGTRFVRAPATPGERILARRCESCHVRPNPTAMSREDWLQALDEMHERISIPTAEWDTLASLAGGESLP